MSGYRAALLANLHRAARKHDNKGQDGRLRVRKDKVLDAVAFQDHLTVAMKCYDKNGYSEKFKE